MYTCVYNVRILPWPPLCYLLLARINSRIAAAIAGSQLQLAGKVQWKSVQLSSRQFYIADKRAGGKRMGGPGVRTVGCAMPVVRRCEMDTHPSTLKYDLSVGAYVIAGAATRMKRMKFFLLLLLCETVCWTEREKHPVVLCVSSLRLDDVEPKR